MFRPDLNTLSDEEIQKIVNENKCYMWDNGAALPKVELTYTLGPNTPNFKGPTYVSKEQIKDMR